MPIFEYRCADCGGIAEQLVRRDEPLDACPVCGGESLERILSACRVRTPRVDFSALRATSSEVLARPERFGDAMSALQARTGVKLDSQRVEAAMDRLSKAGPDRAAE